MNVVQPIRSKKQIEDLKMELKKSGYRNYMLFYIGINTGMRISDILKLKVKDVRDTHYLKLKEKKTGKPRRTKLSDEMLQELEAYTSTMKEEEYLFQSRIGDNKPITRVQSYRILNAAAEKVGIEEIGTHTLRKTFGYWYYKKFNDIAKLQSILNHSTPEDTLRYIGISQDEIDETLEDFSL